MEREDTETGLRREVTVAAFYGGSFDPPHVSHVLCAAYVLSTELVDELWVMPAFDHPLGKRFHAPYEDRLAMAELAFADLRRVRVSRLESELDGGPSRTLTTVEALKERHPDTRFRLVIGADILDETHLWHRFDRIAELAPPLVVGRMGFPIPDGVEIALPEVSSTEIRTRLAEGRTVSGLVPAAVRNYIGDHDLYRSPGEPPPPGDGEQGDG
jgi:nicotinate-nucleotide adenylyltransferase